MTIEQHDALEDQRADYWFEYNRQVFLGFIKPVDKSIQNWLNMYYNSLKKQYENL